MLASSDQAKAHGQTAKSAPEPASGPDIQTPIPNVPEILQQIRPNIKLITHNLHMDPGYDYNRFTPDPDEVFSDLIQDVEHVASKIRNIGKQSERSQTMSERYKGYLRDAVVRMVHTSNAIENAGVGYEVTRSLVSDILNGKQMLGELGEDDVRYQAIMDHLSQKNADTSYEAVQQAYRQVIQHVYALFYMIDHMLIQNNPLSEALLRQTHQILTFCINAENSERDSSTSYGGMYRTEGVGWTPFSSFATPSSIPRRVASAITEFNTAIHQSKSTKAMDPYELAAKVSHQILNIHPFLNGNSRLSRLLLNTVLLKYTGTTIPFGRDPVEAAKWKETVARAVEWRGRLKGWVMMLRWMKVGRTGRGRKWRRWF